MRVPTLPPAFRTSYATDDARTCYGCGFETTDALKDCPACGHRLRAARAVRRIGWVLVVMGGALVATGIALVVALGRIILRTGDPGATTAFTGGPREAALVYGAFAGVIAVGAGITFGGAWQVRYGRPNRKVVAVAFLVVVAGLLARRVLNLIG